MADRKKKKEAPKRAPKRKAKKGKKGRSRKLGRGAKVFLTLIALAIVVMGAYLGMDKLNRALRAAKVQNVSVDLEIGGAGEEPGKFREPWGICVDTKGNLVVADFGNHRIERFDPEGRLLQSFGVRGQKEGDFEQPNDVWVDSDDALYVADTFNHRIQKFDAKGRFVAQWKHSFFGPRGIAGDANGRVYVTDTGNHKIQVFDRDGHFVKEFGRMGTKEGELQEPMGIAVDAKGFVYVCDTENRRIQKFDPKGQFVAAIKVPGWKGKCCESPYIALANDSLYVTQSSEDSVLRLSPEGKLLAIYRKPNGFSGATGLAADAEGRLWVAERSISKVARFRPPAGPASK